MQSFSKRQQQVINNKIIDLNSDSPSSFKQFDGKALETALYNIAVEFINSAVDNLNAADRVSTGGLLESIKPSEIVVMGKKMTINISVLDYYKFIDKGVKGWRSGEPGDSPYAFKAPADKSGKKSSEMVTAIRKWLIKEGLKAKATSKNPKHAISARESRRQKITDTATSTAIMIAGMVRSKGLKKTNFWTDAEATASKFAEKEFETALTISVINSL
jgi:hypothetical protein